MTTPRPATPRPATPRPAAPCPHPPRRLAPRLTPRRHRAVAGLAAGALSLALVPALAAPASAAPLHPGLSGAAVTASGLAGLDGTEEAPAAGRAWLEGVVVDLAGRPVAGIEVAALDLAALAGDPGAAPTATATTAAEVLDGPAAGSFRLDVPRGAEADVAYEVRLAGPDGAGEPFRPLVLPEPVEVGASTTEGLSVDLGTVVLHPEALAEATIRLVAGRALGNGRPGKVSVAVTSPDVSVVTGRVALRIDGRFRGRRQVGAGDSARTTFSLPRLRPGSHVVEVDYRGSADVAATSASLEVEVDRPARGRDDGTGTGTGKGKGKGSKGGSGTGGPGTGGGQRGGQRSGSGGR